MSQLPISSNYPQGKNIRTYQIARVPLARIYCDVYNPDMKKFSQKTLFHSPAYQYLVTKNREHYDAYYTTIREEHNSKDHHAVSHLEALLSSFEERGYDESILVICRISGKKLVIADGQNRAAVMTYLNHDSGDYVEIPVLITTDLG
jgi:hypothetical protein